MGTLMILTIPSDTTTSLHSIQLLYIFLLQLKVKDVCILYDSSFV